MTLIYGNNYRKHTMLESLLFQYTISFHMKFLYFLKIIYLLNYVFLEDKFVPNVGKLFYFVFIHN